MFELNPSIEALKNGDVYCIQCSDGTIDISQNCLDNSDMTVIVDIANLDADTFIDWLEYDENGYAVHPYGDCISDLVFNGTVNGLKQYLDTLNL